MYQVGGENYTEQKILNIVKIIPDRENIYIFHREIGGQKQKAQQATFKNLKERTFNNIANFE